MNSAKKKKNRILILVAGALLAALALIVLFTPALIEIKGEKEVEVAYGESYKDEGAAVRFGLGKVKTENNVDTSQLGDQIVTYRFLTEKAVRKVTVKDVMRPNIVLKGSLEKYLVLGQEYEEAGVTATDDVDGDITAKVQIESDLDINKSGEYHISYTVSDSSGNAARVRRKVTVVDKGPMSQGRIDFDLDPFYDDVICKEFPYAGDSPIISQSHNEAMYKSLLIFGDSFVGNLGDYGVVSYDQLWSRGSLGTDTVYDMPITVYGYYDDYTTFFDAMDAYHPEVMLILLNSDRTLHWTPEYLASSCDNFYNDISSRYPDTTFIICSIMPVDIYYSSEEWIQREGFDRNDRINKMNVQMCELCRKYGFKFMNAAESVKDPATGCCYDGYIGEDGIHLSYDGYVRMREYIQNHMDW